MAHHGALIDHLTRVLLKLQLYDDTWQLRHTFFLILKY
jgi:hypothetical protein